MNRKYLVISGIFLITLGIISTSGAFAEKSAYKSGYDHGCDDVGLPPQDRYINQPEKGPGYHTKQFMKGYDDGYATCKEAGTTENAYYESNTAVDDSFNNRDSVVQPQQQYANTNQVGGCPQQIINGDCILTQGQETNNDFAQANRADN